MKLVVLTISALIVFAMAAYALDRGIYVGSERYVMGAKAVPDLDFLQKRCRYLFITGISEIALMMDVLVLLMHEPIRPLWKLQSRNQTTAIADCSPIEVLGAQRSRTEGFYNGGTVRCRSRGGELDRVRLLDASNAIS